MVDERAMEAFANFRKESKLPNPEDSSSEEDESEPDEPGPKFLWAAQHDNIDLIKNLYKQDPNLIKFADSDGYTALHRAAYSGSKASTYIFKFLGAPASSAGRL